MAEPRNERTPTITRIQLQFSPVRKRRNGECDVMTTASGVSLKFTSVVQLKFTLEVAIQGSSSRYLEDAAGCLAGAAGDLPNVGTCLVGVNLGPEQRGKVREGLTLLSSKLCVVENAFHHLFRLVR